ncbi:probable beta-1,3-galactosyltransferase 14 [Vitis riparia]|uniref:probable beta-1,3-galactosyltransferase 14 n=1 Tax=Vitis riparia TaxID=96939 RepID=UPI00155A4CCC|nr:probable beta-1,3-galactosyltransferase 14 [Vitis riparia]
MGFIGIQTMFGYVGQQRSLRKSWMPTDQQGLQRLEDAIGSTFMFVIGRANNKAKMAKLRKEVAQYDDFMLLDIEEYSKLPYKMLAFFKVTYALFDFELFVKVDDDRYLKPDCLSLLLAVHTLNLLDA